MFFRVRNKVDHWEADDFKTIEEARSFIIENNIHENTHELLRYTNKKDVTLEFFEVSDKLNGAIIKSTSDPDHWTLLTGMTGVRQ